LYGLTTAVHLGQALYKRMWFLLPTAVMCGVTELLGWSGRLWSSKQPWNSTPFTIQISTTIIAPTFVLAANFVILGQLILSMGPQYSRLSPKLYKMIFITCDVIALTVQAVGGGKASTADNEDDANKGGRIMLGGIVFQLIAIIVYAIVSIEFLFRFKNDRPFPNRADAIPREPLPTKSRLMLLGLAISGSTMLIRSIYRTIELTDGWSGKVIATEIYFIIFDGVMMVCSMTALNVLHPGWLLPPPRTSAYVEKDMQAGNSSIYKV
jgi:hypothetical protein